MNADPLARAYRWFEYAAFAGALERCRFFFLPRMRQSHRVLILGEGDGRFLARLLARNAHTTVDVVDRSAGMIGQARRRVRPADTNRVRFLQGDALTCLFPQKPYDMVVTHFFLDCLSAAEVERLCGKIREVLAEDGAWIVSEFQIPQKGWSRWHARLWVRTMYWFFAWTTGLAVRTLPPYSRILQSNGFALTGSRHWRFGLIASECYTVRDPELSTSSETIADPPGPALA